MGDCTWEPGEAVTRGLSEGLRDAGDPKTWHVAPGTAAGQSNLHLGEVPIVELEFILRLSKTTVLTENDYDTSNVPRSHVLSLDGFFLSVFDKFHGYALDLCYAVMVKFHDLL